MTEQNNKNGIQTMIDELANEFNVANQGLSSSGMMKDMVVKRIFELVRELADANKQLKQDVERLELELDQTVYPLTAGKTADDMIKPAADYDVADYNKEW